MPFFDVAAAERADIQSEIGHLAAFFADRFAFARCQLAQKVVKALIVLIVPMKLLAQPLQIIATVTKYIPRFLVAKRDVHRRHRQLLGKLGHTGTQNDQPLATGVALEITAHQ